MENISLKPHIKLIESICLKRFNYSEEGHECFVHVLDRLMENNYARVNAFQGRSTFKTYLVSITTRLAIDFYRHRYGKISKKSNPEQITSKRSYLKVVPITDQENLSDEKPLDHIVIKKEDEDAGKRLEEILQSLVSDLSPEDRLLLKMKYDDDFKVSEIAALLNLDQKRTYRKIDAILSSLKEKILKEHVDLKRILDVVTLILIFLVLYYGK